jgi:hypothetical protein
MIDKMTTSTRTTLHVTALRLRLGRPLRQAEAAKLRGYFGRRFPDEVLVHHHEKDGTLRYAYPRIQFKVLGTEAHLIGLAEGSNLVARFWAEVDRTEIDWETLHVLEATMSRCQARIGESNESVCYRFLTPWLGLNQRNYRIYRELNHPGERAQIVERVLVGNCLSLAKAFGHRVEERLRADATELRTVKTHLKGVPLIGLLGQFRVNFLLPSLIGIGKSVSRGFGTVQRTAADVDKEREEPG